MLTNGLDARVALRVDMAVALWAMTASCNLWTFQYVVGSKVTARSSKPERRLSSPVSVSLRILSKEGTNHRILTHLTNTRHPDPPLRPFLLPIKAQLLDYIAAALD